jgi:hypothetical protein
LDFELRYLWPQKNLLHHHLQLKHQNYSLDKSI